MQEVLKKFGRYFLLDQVAQGGMAEIFRARQVNPDGLGRLLVIKRIQSSYGTNSEFVSMFRSEIKVMMNFNHPNIVQLQDYGEEQKQPFIAMEYVEGRSLRQIRDRYFEKVGGMPPELAAYLVSQVAAGLHYAHVFKDRVSGQPLSIVHRDVSPQNILISYDGNVKVIDFGIAKASVNSEQTRAGVIKGKIGYLSPEQINPQGGVLDARSDLFSLGIVLWELLTGKKLFTADNDIAIMRMIENCTTSVRPPSERNPKVPKELDRIVMQALAKNRDQRFANCQELQKQLQKFIVQHSPDFNPTDIGNEIKALFASEIVTDRKLLQRLNDRAENLMSLQQVEEPPAPEVNDAGAQTRGTDSSGARNFDSTQVDAQGSVNVQVPLEVRQPTQSRPRSTTPTGSARVTAGSSSRNGGPPKAVRQKSGPSFGMLAMIAAAIGGVWVLYGDQLGGVTPSPVSPPSGAQQRSPGSEDQMAVLLQLNPVGGIARIRVNGKDIGEGGGAVQIPVDGPLVAKVPRSTSLQVSIEANGYKTLEYEGSVDPQKLEIGAYGKELRLPLSLEPEVYGVLRYRSGIASASLRVEIGGQSWVYKSSLSGGTEVVKLPPGTYRLEFFSPSLNMSQIIPNVTIEAGGSMDQEVILRK